MREREQNESEKHESEKHEAGRKKVAGEGERQKHNSQP